MNKVIIKGWVARDCMGIFFFLRKPTRFAGCFWDGYKAFELPIDSFPEITWENEPVKKILTVE